MADKIIGLDLSKRDGFNKAITGRVGDKNTTYLFRLFNNGVLFDLTKATQITLLGLTPTGYYVDAVGFPQADGTIKVDIPSAFNAEVGYFQRCFIRVVTTDDKILSTQDLIYYSYGNADMSAGGGQDYIGRVEELIKELNEAADNFTTGLTDKYNKALTDLQELTGKMDSLDARMDALESGGALMKTEADMRYMGIKGGITTEDLNTVRGIGTYGLKNASGENRPNNAKYGSLLVLGDTAGQGNLQIFIDGSVTMFRKLNGATWGAWVTLGNAADFYTKTEVDTKIANIKPTLATGAEIDIGMDNSKMVTPKALADSTYIKYAEGETIAKNSIESDKASMLANKQLFMIDSSNSTYIKGGSIKLERVGDTCYMSGIINTRTDIPTNVNILTSGNVPEWFNSDTNRNAISIFAGKLTNCFFEYNSNTIKLDSQAVPANSWMALNASAFPAKTHM